MKTKVAIIALALLCSSAIGRNAADLKADLDAMKPAGTRVKLAYIVNGASGFQEFAMDASGSKIWVVDGNDGIKRVLSPSGDLYNINLTADGSRVIYWNAGTTSAGVVNFDGTGAKTLNVGGTLMEYYRAENKDWAVVFNGGTQVTIVNIDNVVDKKTVYNNGYSSLNVCDDGVGLSDDGKVLLLYDCNSAKFGLWTVGGSGASAWKAVDGGCQPSLRAGTPYQYNINPSGHANMWVHNADGSIYASYTAAATVNTALGKLNLTGTCNGGSGNVLITQEGTRFTQHRDYATFFMSQSKANPILVRLPDMKFTYVEDGLACKFVGDMDAVFVGATNVIPKATAVSRAAPTASSYYSVQGKSLQFSAVNSLSKSGVVLKQSTNGFSTKIMLK